MDVAQYAAIAAAAKPMPKAELPAPVEGLVAHVDGDYCAYFCAGNDDVDPGTARRIFLNTLDKIKQTTGATSVIVHLTDPASSKADRYLVATVKPYQGQRKAGRKPKNWALLREFMSGYDGEKFRVKNWLQREVDDGIAYLVHHSMNAGINSVIATADKDMRMLPGRHYIWKTKQIVDVPFGTWAMTGPDGKLYGHKYFWLQVLQGDTADFIPGLPKYKERGVLKQVGEATAAALMKDINNNDEALARCRELYASYYDDEGDDRLVEQMCLLWLRTDRAATLLNFCSILSETPADFFDACTRLVDRVETAKQELAAIKENGCAG